MELILPAIYGITGLGASGFAWFGLKSLAQVCRVLTPQQRTTPDRDRVNRRGYGRVGNRFKASIEMAGMDATRVSVPAKGIDISRGGVGVKARHAVAPGSTVFVHLKNLYLMGFAEVRHCTPEGSWYKIGLQFHDEPQRTGMGTWEIHRVRDTGWYA